MNDSPFEDLGQRVAAEERLLRRRTIRKPAPVRPIDRTGPLPVSPAQKRMWVYDRLVVDPVVNNVCRAERLRGPLSVENLVCAFRRTVERHETLRFCFQFDGSDLWTVPSKKVPELDHVKLDVLEFERDKICDLIYADHRGTRFDLKTDPPVAATLYEFAPDDFLFVYIVHHIACDEWSIRRLQTELGAQYEACRRDAAPDVLPLPIQYADYAAWQLRGLAEGRWSEAEAYWKAHLKGAPTQAVLPHARRYPETLQRGMSLHQNFSVATEVAARLDEIGRRHGATPFMVSLAATLAYLHRSTGQQDLAISSVTAARPSPELDGIVGMFTNNTVIRSQVDSGERFSGMVDRARDLVVNTLRHQDYPFDAMLSATATKRSEVPFSDIMFTHRRGFTGSIQTDSIHASGLSSRDGRAKFGLWFSVVDSEGGREVRLVADGNVFDQEGLAQLARDYETFLERLSEVPDIRLEDLQTFAAGAAEDQRSRSASTSDRAPISSDTLKSVGAIWRSVLGQEPRSDKMSFFDEGGDSLLLLQLVHRISEETGVQLSMRAAFADPTINGHARLVEQATDEMENGRDASPMANSATDSDGSDLAIVPLSPKQEGQQRPFFIVSGAGGHVLPFAPMAHKLSSNWRGFGILDPGFFPQTDEITALDETAHWMNEKVVGVAPEGPIILAGYSYGAHVAFEMAAQLRRSGRPTGLVLLDTRLTRVSLRRHVKELSRSARSFARRTFTSRSTHDMDPADNMHALYDEGMRAERKRRSVLSAKQRAMLLNYRPTQLDVPVVLIRACDQVTEKDRPDYGWSDLAPVLEVHDVEGDHLNFFKGVREDAFAEALQKSLERLQREFKETP